MSLFVQETKVLLQPLPFLLLLQLLIPVHLSLFLPIAAYPPGPRGEGRPPIPDPIPVEKAFHISLPEQRRQRRGCFLEETRPDAVEVRRQGPR